MQFILSASNLAYDIPAPYFDPLTDSHFSASAALQNTLGTPWVMTTKAFRATDLSLLATPYSLCSKNNRTVLSLGDDLASINLADFENTHATAKTMVEMDTWLATQLECGNILDYPRDENGFKLYDDTLTGGEGPDVYIAGVFDDLPKRRASARKTAKPAKVQKTKRGQKA